MTDSAPTAPAGADPVAAPGRAERELNQGIGIAGIRQYPTHIVADGLGGGAAGVSGGEHHPHLPLVLAHLAQDAQVFEREHGNLGVGDVRDQRPRPGESMLRQGGHQTAPGCCRARDCISASR